MANFKFTGEMIFPKVDAKKPFVKTFSGGADKKTPMASLNLGIKASDNNMAFVEMFGSVQKVVKTMNTDNEKIEFPWDDRFDEEIIKTIANYKKITVDLGEEIGRKDFVSEYDAILYLKDTLGKYKGKVCITGQMEKQWYKDRYYDKFKIQNVYAVDSDAKNKFTLTVDVYYAKDGMDDKDFKKESRIYLDGYIKQYINKDEGTKFVPQQFVLDGSKVDFNNEKHVAQFDYRKKYMSTDKKTVVHMLWDVNYLNGADTVDFDESQLTKAQKEQVELGLATVESFKPRGDIYGDRVSEFRLSKPNLTGDFADGLVDTELKISEFEEQLYIPNATEEKLEDVVKKAEKKEEVKEETKQEPEPEIDDEDLFS
jgi:hypothetical protein